MDDASKVIPFPPRRTPEAELPSLWAWADRAARYGFYPQDMGDGPVSTTDDGQAYVTITTGQPSNAGRYRLDWTPQGWRMWTYDDQGGDNFTGMFRTLREALEVICPTDPVVA
jgi:hypothetical protein